MKDEVIYEFIPEAVGEEVPEQEQQLGAIAFLVKEHRQVQSLLRQCLKSRDKRQQQKLAAEICEALKIHTQLEEELVYPLMHKEDAEEETVCATEHQLVALVIKALEPMKASQSGFIGRIKVLNLIFNDHVKEEETKALPEFEQSGVADMQQLGWELAQRKKQLVAQIERKAARKLQTQGKKTAARSASGGKKTAVSAFSRPLIKPPAKKTGNRSTTARRKSA